MNKYNIRKALLTLGLSGTMVLVAGCSSKEEKVVPNQRVEQELNSTSLTMEPIDTSEPNITEEPIVTVIPKEKQEVKTERKIETIEETRNRVLKAIEKSEFDSLMKDILKDIVVHGVKDDKWMLEEISLTCKYQTDIYGMIMTVSSETQGPYKLERLRLLEHFKVKDTPEFIRIMENTHTYGKYRFYYGINSGEDSEYLVTDKDDNILLVAAKGEVKEAKDYHLQNHKLQKLKSALKKYDITPKNIYSWEELFDEVAALLSIHMSNGTREIGDLKSIKTSDIMVLDSSELCNSDKYENRYHFLKYRSPYLFSGSPYLFTDRKADVYTDIFNLDAMAILGRHIADYKEPNKDIMYESLIPFHKTTCFSSLNSFLKSQGIPAKEQISYEELKELNKKVNKCENKVFKKTRNR